MASRLIKAGADLTASDVSNADNAFHAVVRGGKEELIDDAFAHATTSALKSKDHDGNSLPHLAAVTPGLRSAVKAKAVDLGSAAFDEGNNGGIRPLDAILHTRENVAATTSADIVKEFVDAGAHSSKNRAELFGGMMSDQDLDPSVIKLVQVRDGEKGLDPDLPNAKKCLL